MKLSKSDMITGFIGVSILAGLGYLLYFDITRIAGAGSTEIIGKIISTRNVTERKYSAQVVWDEVFKDSKVYNFDTVRTADMSEAIIKLKDGTEITLSENSMILLAISAKEVDIKFIQGTINAKQSKAQNTKQQKVNIVSGESKVSLSNSDVSMSQSTDNQLQVTVNRGKAMFKSGNEEKTLNENQNILAGKDSIRLYDLAIRLALPENNKYIPITSQKTNVNFSWEPLKGDYATTLEISNNPSLIDPSVKKKSPGNFAAVGLAEGIYYWRVVAVHNATKKVEMSEIRKLSIMNNKPVQLILPSNNSLIKYRDVKPMINFLWSRNESVPRYNLIISGKSDMSVPVVNTIVDGNKISLNSLSHGTYYWKVKNNQDSEQMNTGGESNTLTFTISKTDKLPPPEPIYPPDEKSIHPVFISQKGLNFSWNADSSIPETQISIAEDKDFTKIILKKTCRDNFIRIVEKFNDGNYYWSLRGIMSDGSTTETSAVRRFKVAQQESIITLIEPKDKSIITRKNIDNEAAVSFSWAKTEIEGRFRIQISKDKNFISIAKEQNTGDLSAIINGISEGVFYWRVKLLDAKGAELLESPVYSAELLSMLDNPVVIEPKNGTTINMAKKNTLDFQWKQVPSANLYRIGLYQIKGGIQHSIMTLETRNSQYQLSDLKKLDEGKFIWTLQALDIDQSMNRLKRKSEETRIVFSITLGTTDKSIDIKTPKILYLE